MFLGFEINRQGTSDAASAAKAREVVQATLATRKQQSTQLLDMAKRSNHPGIILRSACQIPADAKEYRESVRQLRRSEQLLDEVVGRLERRELARKLQESHYSQGQRVKCTVIEGREPQLRMSYILFGETTAYRADRLLDKSTQRLIVKAGFHKLSWDDGYGEGSTLSFEHDQAESIQFGEVRELCEAVRRGEKNPDEMNATQGEQRK